MLRTEGHVILIRGQKTAPSARARAVSQCHFTVLYATRKLKKEKEDILPPPHQASMPCKQGMLGLLFGPGLSFHATVHLH